MRALTHSLSIIVAVGVLLLGTQGPVFATPAILMTQDVGSEVNVRVQPNSQATILYRGQVGERLNTLDDRPGDDGFVWYKVQFDASGLQGWVREDLLQLGTHEAPFRSGNYWVGPVGMGLEIDGDQYRYYDETGEGEWRSTDELRYVMDGVVLYGGDHWCHADLPKPELLLGQGSSIPQCSVNGWNWLSF